MTKSPYDTKTRKCSVCFIRYAVSRKSKSHLHAKEDLKEACQFEFDQMRYDPSVESFTEVLSKFKKTAKNAYEEKAIEITERFLIAKLPIQPQNEFAMADKHVASREN